MRKAQFLALGTLMCLVFASCVSGPSKRSFGPYSDAEVFYGEGNYSKAIEKYQEYLLQSPRGNLAAVAEYYVAKSYVALKDTVKARESFERVVERYPKTSWAAFSEEQLEALGGDVKS